MSLSPFRPFPAAALALLLAAACAKPEPPVAGRGALWEGPRAICDEYLFDTALANGQVATATIERADGLYDYLPPDTNLLGVRQRRFVIDLRPTVPQPGLPDIVWFHGGGGDAGMAAWLFLHPHGHGYGPDVTETRAADLLLGALLADAPSRGAYGVGPQGIIPLEE
jgi:hypothetical protein